MQRTPARSTIQRASDRIEALQRQRSTLQEQVKALSTINSSLLFRSSLLDALCTTFSLFRANVESNLLGEEAHSDVGQVKQQQLEQLLQTLQAAAGISNNSSSSAQRRQSAQTSENQHVSDESIIRIAPRTEPMAYFNSLMRKRPVSTAALTSEGLARILRETVLQASVIVFQDSLEGQAELCKAEELTSTYLHMLVSLLLHGRPDVIAGVSAYNLANLTVEPEAVVQRTARLTQLPPLLGLSSQQLQDIATGVSLFQEMMARIHEEQRQLQAEYILTAGSSSRECFSSVNQSLEAQQQHTARMQVLLHKEYAISAAMTGFLVGCLSWQQVTKAMALAWPYPVSSTALGQVIARYSMLQQAGRTVGL